MVTSVVTCGYKGVRRQRGGLGGGLNMCYQHYQVLHDSMLCTWCIVTSVTWWYHLVTFGYRRYLVLQYPRLYTLCTGQHSYHSSYLCLASAITIIVQWIHSIVALLELLLLPVTWACNLIASPHILHLPTQLYSVNCIMCMIIIVHNN